MSVSYFGVIFKNLLEVSKVFDILPNTKNQNKNSRQKAKGVKETFHPSVPSSVCDSNSSRGS
jgi:hypothetical protein